MQIRKAVFGPSGTCGATLALFALLGACGTVDETLAPPAGRLSGGVIDAGIPDDMAGINATGAGAGSGADTGLPCDVQQLLENRCIGCHLSSSPPPLLTYDDLLRPRVVGGKTMAETSVERMKSATSPMPPPPAVLPTVEEIAVLENWVKAGSPKGASCTPAPGTPAAPSGGVYNTPLTCTSGKTWTGGRRESPDMYPGRACITCHTMEGGPDYVVAGTVYPSAHEPNDCNGVNAGVTVVVTDATGKVTNVPVRGTGNFSFKGRIAPPFKVKVVGGGKERVMATAVTAGDCNACHTAAGVNGAPGRIMSP